MNNTLSLIKDEEIAVEADYLKTLEQYLSLCLERHKLKQQAVPGNGNGSGAIIAKLEGLASKLRDRLDADTSGANLEKLRARFSLTAFERDVTGLLFLMETNPLFKTAFFASFPKKDTRSRYPMVGDVLSILCPEYKDSLENRKAFSLRGILLSKNIIETENPLNSGSLDNEVRLSNMYINYILGDAKGYLDWDMDAEFEQPKVKFEDVVIEKEINDEILSFVSNYGEYRRMLEQFRVNGASGYGNASVFLFHGRSGTGKTMLARAIATYLKKPLMNVDFKKLMDRSFYTARSETMLKKVFRKAEIYDAVLLFDECDEGLAQDRQLSRDFIIELEKFTGIVIMACNKAVALPSALDRRIIVKAELNLPDDEMREKIWKIHFPDTSVLAPDVDFKKLAEDFDFTGGLIKNASLTAMALAMQDRKGGKMKVTMKDFVKACELTTKHMLSPVKFTSIFRPKKAVKDLKLSGTDEETVRGAARIIKGYDLQYAPRILLYRAPVMSRIGLHIGEAIAKECGMKAVILPAHMYLNDKSYYGIHAGFRGTPEELRTAVRLEISNPKILLILDDRLGLMHRMDGESMMNLDNLFLELARLKNPVLIISSATEFSRCFAYSSIALGLENVCESQKDELVTEWKKLFDGKIKFAKEVTPEKLMSIFKFSIYLVADICDDIRLLNLFKGKKTLTLQDMENLLKTRFPLEGSIGKPLFGEEK